MPLDTKLFQYLTVAVKRHFIYSSKLSMSDKKKHSFDTILHFIRGFHRLINSKIGSPTQERNIQDIENKV